MSDISTQMMRKAINKCHWRMKVAGIFICAGVCMPCEKAIYDGKCDALAGLVKKQKEN